MRPSDIFESIDPESPLRRVTFLGGDFPITLSDYAGIAFVVGAMVLAGIAVALK